MTGFDGDMFAEVAARAGGLVKPDHTKIAANKTATPAFAYA